MKTAIKTVLDKLYDQDIGLMSETERDELLAAYKEHEKWLTALQAIASGATTCGDDLIALATEALK